jgi:hypothetical protein
MKKRKIGRKPDRKIAKRQSRQRHATARSEVIKVPLLNLSSLPTERPLVCRFHEGELPDNKSCVDGTECAAVNIARGLEHRVRAIWGLADEAYDGVIAGADGVRSVSGHRLMSFEAAFETIKVLARSIKEEMMQDVSPDKRLDKPALQFLGNFGLIGEWPGWDNRMQLRNPSEARRNDKALRPQRAALPAAPKEATS